MEFITVTIDGKRAVAPAGSNIVEAAKRCGIEIPTLCYDKELEVVSSCRLCVVEVEGINKLVTACSTPIQEGMVVFTETEKVVEVRKMILQLLLDNHPNDCLTCDKSGSCDLQKYAYRYNVTFRNHDGARRGTEMANFTDMSSPYILRDESKCILCGKCVRTCAKVETRNVLGFANRGFETKISANNDLSLEESTCVSCNRCVVACPVGALVDRRAMGKGRAWETEYQEVKCKSCDFGCNMKLHKKAGKIVAVTAKKPSNGRPLCLKGRLLTELEYSENPQMPFKKVEGEKREFVETSWMDVLGLGGVYDKLKDIEGAKND